MNASGTSEHQGVGADAPGHLIAVVADDAKLGAGRVILIELTDLLKE